MLELALAMTILVIILVFVLDAGIFLFRFSGLNHATNVLSRRLAIDLGKAFRNETISQTPWNGNCNNYLRSLGNGYLLGDHSMSDPTRLHYYGVTLDNSTALVTGSPDSPYAILRIVGQLSPPCVFCSFFPNIQVRSESSVLIEYDKKTCTDY